MLALYLDEDAQHGAIVDGLRRRGVDVTSARIEGMLGRADEDQLAFAARSSRSIFSYNVHDYARIHDRMMHASESHSGIVLVHKDRFHFGEQIRRLERLARAQTPEDMVNAVVFLQDWGDERDQ